jgi:cell fate (sporulation/competence/biofilm development) regulator YlbF (YheA/YmcA/DUF963 family)
MTLEEKARDLGRIIGQSSEYQALRRANDALGADRDALDMLRQMEQLRLDAHRMLERGERPTEEMEKQLDTLLGQVQVNPTYQRLVVAQENFDKIMGKVNDWILQGIEKGAASPIITLS